MLVVYEMEDDPCTLKATAGLKLTVVVPCPHCPLIDTDAGHWIDRGGIPD